jgi:hypothetical protein
MRAAAVRRHRAAARRIPGRGGPTLLPAVKAAVVAICLHRAAVQPTRTVAGAGSVNRAPLNPQAAGVRRRPVEAIQL